MLHCFVSLNRVEFLVEKNNETGELDGEIPTAMVAGGFVKYIGIRLLTQDGTPAPEPFPKVRALVLL